MYPYMNKRVAIPHESEAPAHTLEEVIRLGMAKSEMRQHDSQYDLECRLRVIKAAGREGNCVMHTPQQN